MIIYKYIDIFQISISFQIYYYYKLFECANGIYVCLNKKKKEIVIYLNYGAPS